MGGRTLFTMRARTMYVARHPPRAGGVGVAINRTSTHGAHTASNVRRAAAAKRCRPVPHLPAARRTAYHAMCTDVFDKGVCRGRTILTPMSWVFPTRRPITYESGGMRRLHDTVLLVSELYRNSTVHVALEISVVGRRSVRGNAKVKCIDAARRYSTGSTWRAPQQLHCRLWPHLRTLPKAPRRNPVVHCARDTLQLWSPPPLRPPLRIQRRLAPRPSRHRLSWTRDKMRQLFWPTSQILS